MSILPPKQNKDCPPSFGGCTCWCHHIPGVHHTMPCCLPSDEDNRCLTDDEWADIVNDIILKDDDV